MRDPRDPFIQTATGHAFYLTRPTPSQVRLEDIAHALAYQSRYNGNTRPGIEWPYSVAQHSVFVASLCSDEHALCGLMHDAPEAYIGDCVAPLKALLPEYRAIEAYVWSAIASACGLPATIPDEVKRADIIALATEFRDVMAPPRDPVLIEWRKTLPPPAVTRIDVWSPREAKARFLRMFLDLSRGRAA